MGCLFIGKPWQQDEQTERAFCIVCGSVTLPASGVRAKIRSCSVVVKYHSARGARIICTAKGKGNALRAMYSLEKKDVALFVGELVTKRKKNRRGIPTENKFVECDLVLPADLIEIMIELSASKTVQGFLQEELGESFGKGYKELQYEQRIEREQRIQEAAKRAKEKENW